jgi:hypothetical protein
MIYFGGDFCGGPELEASRKNGCGLTRAHPASAEAHRKPQSQIRRFLNFQASAAAAASIFKLVKIKMIEVLHSGSLLIL